MNELKQVRVFKKKYKIKRVNSSALLDTLKKQGFTLVFFNGVDDTEDVSSLVALLDLGEQIHCSKCFTYQDDKQRIVFINEGLSEEERTIVLAHEEGHIFSGHMTKNNVFGEDVLQEHQANQFAHYLLKDKDGNIRKRKLIIGICIVLIILISGTTFFLKRQHDDAVYTENLYRTETGSKYHVRDCMYIKDKTDVYKLTKEEFDSGEYEPCGACKPNER